MGDLLHEIRSLSDQEEEGRRKKRKEEIEGKRLTLTFLNVVFEFRKNLKLA